MQNPEKELKKVKRRRFIKRLLIAFVLFAFVVFLLNAMLFSLGVRTGFFYRWLADQYAGTITEVHETDFVIRVDGEDVKKTVFIFDDTRIREGRKNRGLADLHMGEHVIIFGAFHADDGINARLVQIFSGDQ